MPSVFICYRRDDSRHQVGRLYDRLAERFGRTEVFKDVDSVPLGVDFRHVLSEKVGRCDVVLVLIGDDWLQARLDSPEDYVRIEIESALERKIPVIPVLVGTVGMPAAEKLPPSLRPVAYRNGLHVRPDPDFNGDIARLIHGIESAVDPSQRPLRRRLDRRWLVAIPIVLTVILLIGGLALWNPFGTKQTRDTTPGTPPTVPSAKTPTEREIPLNLSELQPGEQYEVRYTVTVMVKKTRVEAGPVEYVDGKPVQKSQLVEYTDYSDVDQMGRFAGRLKLVAREVDGQTTYVLVNDWQGQPKELKVKQLPEIRVVKDTPPEMPKVAMPAPQ